MRDSTMDIDWRLVQVFVGFEGVSEVSIAADNNRKVTCNCAVFQSSARCKHTRFVKARMAENDGNYVVQIPEDVPDEEALEAMANGDDWKLFVHKYAKVEALD